jgi:hypothetical protein
MYKNLSHRVNWLKLCACDLNLGYDRFKSLSGHYPEVFRNVPQALQMQGQNLKLENCRFLPHPFELIIHSHAVIRSSQS